jgi:hypothetical protein
MLLAVSLSRSKEEGDREAGYAYDWIRQRQNADVERIRKYVKLQKKVDKLSGRNKAVKRK